MNPSANKRLPQSYDDSITIPSKEDCIKTGSGLWKQLEAAYKTRDLKVKPFDSKELIEQMQDWFGNYKIKKNEYD